MSSAALAWAWSVPGLSPRLALVLLALADSASSVGSVVEFADALVSRSRVSRPVLVESIRELADVGVVWQVSVDLDVVSLQLAVDQEPPATTGVASAPATPADPAAYFDAALEEALELMIPTAVTASPVDDLFTEFWGIYPRRAGKQAALRAWRKAVKTTPAEVVLDGARRLRDDPNLPEKQFVPHPASWLNAGRWDDDPLPPRGGVSNFEKNLSALGFPDPPKPDQATLSELPAGRPPTAPTQLTQYEDHPDGR